MPSESQTDFSGGLNTRSPAHLIGINQCTELQNVDLSHKDLRGEYGTKSGGRRDFYYEAGSSWISSAGFSGATVILDWPYGDSYSGSNSVTISASTNYFSGSPNARIKDGVTITINDGVTVTLYATTQGIHGANSYVEYNDDLYITRSKFDITATSTASSKTLNTGNHTNKLQVGDEIVNTSYINTGTYITSINTASSTVTLSAAAIASGSSQTFSIHPIISKYIDGVTTASYRAGVNRPDPIISYEQRASAYITGRDGSHSDSWYSATDPIPFQYGISEYDETGVESTMSIMTDSNIGTVGGEKFATADVDYPQYITIGNVDRYSTSTTSKGRFALYRVGGSSAVIKRCDNLFLDSDLTVATAETTGPSKLTVTLGSAQNSYQYKVKWYCYNQTSSAEYRYYNSTTGYVYPYDSTPGASVIRSNSGETEYINPSGGNLTFELDASSDTHFADFIVMMKIPGETVEREYVCRAITHDDSNEASADSVDYLDFNRADTLADIQPIEEEITPVRDLTGLTESSNLFYAYKENRLYISDYGNPNSWPASGFLDFDQNITGLGTLGSELVVFTEYSMFRVFGSDPSLLKKVQISTTEGMKNGARNTVTKFQSGLFFAGQNGICFYDGKTVRRATQELLSSFSLPDSTVANNHGGYYEDAYYLLGTSGTGYKIDLKGPPILSRTTQNASNLFFRGSDNILYADTGNIGDPTGTRSNFTVTTRKFSGGDINEEKVYYSVKLTGESFSGTINVLVDGTQTDSFSASNITDLDRTFYLTTPRQGNGIQVQLSNCSGQINRIVVNFDSYTSLSDALFDNVLVKYIGTPTVAVDIDGTNKISATTLSAPSGAIGEAKLYFPAMSNGVVPHLRETNNESSGRVLSFQYTASPV